jgi:Glycosyl hydrolase family 63 C-terminal domain
MDIIGHWLDLLNVDGWIPREQILGSEALRLSSISFQIYFSLISFDVQFNLLMPYFYVFSFLIVRFLMNLLSSIHQMGIHLPYFLLFEVLLVPFSLLPTY